MCRITCVVLIKFCNFSFFNDFLFANNTASAIDVLDLKMAGWSHHFYNYSTPFRRKALYKEKNAQI